MASGVPRGQKSESMGGKQARYWSQRLPGRNSSANWALQNRSASGSAKNGIVHRLMIYPCAQRIVLLIDLDAYDMAPYRKCRIEIVLLFCTPQFKTLEKIYCRQTGYHPMAVKKSGIRSVSRRGSYQRSAIQNCTAQASPDAPRRTVSSLLII